MLLDIIIPQYSETEEEIKYLLNSISLQKNVDFNLINITIVNDASNVILSNEFLMKYNNLDISYIFNKVNTGPGLARELGINSTQNPYIMFMDADDIFFNEYSLEGIIKFIKEHDFKYLVTNIAVEAIKDNKKITYIKRDKETFPWMHGKVFKRSFLKENNISFSTKIRHLEDSYFTTCVLGSLDASEITYFDFTTYLWRLNLKSLTRKKSKYSYMVNTFDEFYKMPFLAYDFLQEKKSKMRYTYIVNSLFAIYIVLNSDLFEFEELKDRRNKYLLSLEKDIKLKRNIFMLIRKEDLAKLYDTQMNYLAVRNGIKYVRKTLDDFLDEYIITSK